MAWLKDCWHLYLCYMAGAAASIPAAAAYATWALYHGDSMKALIPCVAVGLVCFHLAYRRVHKKFGLTI